MNLDKVRATKKESAAYMVDEITHVIKTFGKRDPGSEGEKKAVEYMGDVLKNYCDEVSVEPFEVRPGSFFGWIYYTVTLVLAAVVSLFFVPILSIVFILLGVVIMIGEFVLYRKMLDKLFKAKTSHNLTAVKKPTGEVKRRIFFNGHPDATWEWTVNYHFGGAGFIAHFFISIIGVVYLFALCIWGALAAVGGAYVLSGGPLFIAALCSLVFVPFWIGMYFLSNSKVVVDGANDNLTGCYMGIAIMKALKEQGIEFENTEVGVILSGSEEAGLRGAKAWCEQHKNDFREPDVETLIFAYDTLHEGKFLGVNKLDLNNFVKADPHASELFKNSADELGITCNYCSVPLGATDSAAFNQAGFKATGITAMDHNLQDYYHTRRDTYDNLDVECLADCFDVSVKVLENFDSGR